MLAPQALCPIFWLFEPLKTVSETSFPTSIAIVSFGVFTWPPFRAFSNYQHLLCWFLMTFYWTRKLRSRQWMCAALFLAITQMHMLKPDVSFHMIKICLNLICLWNKWLAMRERSIFEQQKTHEKTKHPKLAHIWRMLSYPGWNMPAFRKCLVELKTQTRLPRRTQDSSNDLFPNM